MNFSEPFRELVHNIFLSEWSILNPGIPIELEDVPFKQPATGAWVKFSIRQNPAKQKTMGNKVLIRTDGFLQIDVIDRPEMGTKSVKLLAESGANIFFSKKFKNADISATFDEKHVDKVPAGGDFVRFMGRVFFIYDGMMTKPTIQFL